jgi:hypothetical protein
MTETLEMRDRVRLELQPDHIGVWPDQPSTGGTGSGPATSTEDDA